MSDILDDLDSPWPADYALQPKNSSERYDVIHVQEVKRQAAVEIRALREQVAALEPAPLEAGSEPVAYATHHDEPMLFLIESEAAAYCDDGEEPIALYAAPQPTDRNAVIDSCVNAILEKGALEDGEYVAALRALKTNAEVRDSPQSARPSLLRLSVRRRAA